MDVTLTAIATATGTCADLHVTAPDGAPARPLLDALRLAVAADPTEALIVDGLPVASDGTAADCGLCDGVVVHVGQPVRLPPVAATHLVVTGGPGAGRRLALTEGDHIVGRDPGCDLVVDDPSVSRGHLVVRAVEGRTTVTDIGSANGTCLDGRRLPAHRPTSVALGTPIAMADSELSVVAAATTDRRAVLADGRVEVHRAPRRRSVRPVAKIVFPAPPTPLPPTRVPILAAVVPVIAGAALALALHQWQFLAFTAVSPIMILGQAAGDRRSTRRAARSARQDYDRTISAAQHRLASAVRDERRRRRTEAPDVTALIGAALSRDDGLWPRAAGDPDALVLRVGRGTLASAVTVVGGPGCATVLDVPICIAMPDVAVFGICGPRALVAGLARSLVIQAATLHSPQALRIVVLAPGNAERWSWTRWLPHLIPTRGERCRALVGFDEDQVTARLRELLATESRSTTDSRRTLVVVDGTVAIRDGTTLTTLTHHAGADLSVIWCADDEQHLPGTTHTVAKLAAAPRIDLHVGDHGRVSPDLLAADVATTAARALAPLRDAGGVASHGLPTEVRWEPLAAVDLSSEAAAARALVRHWSRPPSMTVILGRGTGGDVTVDLSRDGPHLLVAGTTGSGKSELLLSLVASLVSRNRPEHLSLLLIDHKGGATFGPCARLPHTAGVVTDLDADSTQRALRSLTAEVRRREALFASVGATDLDSYTAAATGRRDLADRPPVARLVIAVDEFATLAEEQPDFVGGLVGIAQRGRSLGVHLLLATQRPDGVVSADIRANMALRICLAVARENESRDVIDSPAAATISPSTPGRAFLRCGPADLLGFQAARIGGRRTRASELRVTVCPAAALGSDPPAPVPAVDAGSDLDVLICAARRAGSVLGCVPPAPPWLPPLPARIKLSDLPAGDDPRLAPWGLLDRPATADQQPMFLDLRTGATTVVAGTARSGRTTAALAIMTAAAGRLSPQQLHLWAIDSGAGLSGLADLGHCGAVVPSHEIDRIDRLLGYLTQEVARRRHEQVADDPCLVLIVDSWDGLATAGGDRRGAAAVEALHRLLLDGPAGRLHTIVTTDRAGLVGRLGAAGSERVVLRLADPGDYALIGLPAREVPRRLPVGRGVHAGTLALVQVAYPDRVAAATARRWPAAAQPARRFDRLPHHVTLSQVVARPTRPADQVVLGLGEDDLAPVAVSRRDIGRSFVIAGPPGSGRTSALGLIARQLTGRRLAMLGDGHAVGPGRSDALHLPRDDQEHSVALLDALCANGAPPPDILVDDVDLLADGPLWARLEELVRAPADPGQILVVTSSLDAVTAAFRGPLAHARRARTGLVLCPSSPHDGEPYGIRLPPHVDGSDPPGRAWLVSRGAARRLQLAEEDLAPLEAGSDPGQPAAGTGTSAARACSADRTWLRPARLDV